MIISFLPGKSKRLEELAERYWKAEQEIKMAKQELKMAEQRLKGAEQKLGIDKQRLERAKAVLKSVNAWCDVGKEMLEFYDKNKCTDSNDPIMQELIKKEIAAYREFAVHYPNPEADEKYLSHWLDLLDTKETLN